ncbi:MAG: hypothetical protein J0H68_03625 [Sphingobacteriia bacterium]|nr:hypothetical protein [Sphingobacteriia bacterium]
MESKQVIVASFYTFADLGDLNKLREDLLNLLKSNNVKGTILLATEGLNSTITGSRENIDIVKAYLTSELKFDLDEIHYKESKSDFLPFSKTKVKIRKEIVTFAQDVDVNGKKGKYLTSQEWEDFIKDENNVVIDTRNEYEFEEGHFINSVNPHINKFTEFAEWLKKNKEKFKDKKVAMFCTGGIRCEKSTAYLKQLGHDEVYHLKGGILKYLEETKNQNKLWKGKCFVFDDRTTVNDQLQTDSSNLDS